MTRTSRSEYMEWAKTRSQAPFNLAISGVVDVALAETGLTLEDLELTGPSYYGWPPLQAALAARTHAASECVVATTGTSMANYLALAALIEPADEVLVETPSYGLLADTARHVGADVRCFEREASDGFQIDPERIARALTPRTRAIVLTNLHNPSSAFTELATLRRVGELAREARARVIVDEVYLEALFDDAPASAFSLGPEFVVTSSLTKAYGLGGLRCGWLLAEPEIARRAWRLNDLLGVIPAHLAERASLHILERLPRIAARARALLDTNRARLEQFLAVRDDLECVVPAYGTVVFPRLRKGRVEDVLRVFREKYQGSFVPGRFFGLEQHFRLGFGGAAAVVAEALDRLGRALDEVG